ncbi:cytochrome c oxidase assembly protein [Streptomyces sp. NPDC058667]|uniref:cytochrome c oxidase assembly protein n=1 Tax=Streptomyces sp. NPDC058667 TaxID=3346588 RepID=UPI00366659FE
MTSPHGHSGPAAGGVAALLAGAAFVAVAAYPVAAARLRRRGDAWPWHRDASFVAGGAALVWAVLGPLPGGPFTGHMARHLLTGMVGPLLLVLARPLTLLLRSLAPGRGRRGLLAVAHSRIASLLLFPPTAALLDLGGLWLLHRTSMLAATQHRPLLHAAVQAHVLAAGLLFTFAVCRLDPVRQGTSGFGVRGGTLLAAGAAHAVLAKSLYATAPPGVPIAAADLHTGSQLMYYGGDLVELALALVLAVQWYTAAGRAWARDRRRRQGEERRPRPRPGGALGLDTRAPVPGGGRACRGTDGRGRTALVRWGRRSPPTA